MTVTNTQKLTFLYASYGVTLLLSLVPTTLMVVLTILLAFAVLAAAYHFRKHSAQNDLLHNHAHFTIRSVWIGSIIGVATTLIASVYMFIKVDPSPMMPCMEHLIMMTGDGAALTSTEMMQILNPCMEHYMDANKAVLAMSLATGIAPILLYFFFRFGRGLLHAIKRESVPRVNSWF